MCLRREKEKMLGEKDSNPHKQIQNLLCYHYTIPQLKEKFIRLNFKSQV